MAKQLLRPLERWVKLAVMPPAGAAVIRALGRLMRIERSWGLFLWGPPLWVSPDGDAADLEAKRLQFEALLNDLTAQADEAVSRSPSLG